MDINLDYSPNRKIRIVSNTAKNGKLGNQKQMMVKVNGKVYVEQPDLKVAFDPPNYGVL